jgi:hypothetical protein
LRGGGLCFDFSAARHRCNAPPAEHGDGGARDQRSRNVVASWSCRGFTSAAKAGLDKLIRPSLETARPLNQ